MKHIQKGIESAAKGLTSIAKTLERLSKQLGEQNTTKAPPKRKSAPKKKAPAKKTPAKKAPAKAAKATASDKVFQVIKRSKSPLSTATIQKKTGFTGKKTQPILYRLKKQGKIKSAGKGLYEKA